MYTCGEASVQNNMSRIVYTPEKGKVVKKEVESEPLNPREIRVKVHSAGVNPIDWKTVGFGTADGKALGNDFAGVVIEIGNEVKLFKVGDTVAGGVPSGSATDQGAFSNEVKVDERYVLQFPDKLVATTSDDIPAELPTTFEQAASFGVATGTAIVAIEQSIHPEPGQYALIYGVTSSVGFYAAQLARSVGYKVIGVSSPSPIIEKIGIQWLDRKDPEWVQKSKELSGDNIVFAYDAVVLDGSQNVVPKVLSTHAKSTAFSLSNPLVSPDPSAVNTNTVVSHSNCSFLYNPVRHRGKDVFVDKTRIVDRAPQLYELINKLFLNQQIIALPVKVLHGLDKVSEGLELNRTGLRATKVVIDVE